MFIHFVIRGRLGNAIFRYMACSIICIHYNATYINTHITNKITVSNKIDMTDVFFSTIINGILNNDKIFLNENCVINMTDFYQHDIIYKTYKKEIIDFINKNKHTIMTDGILAGDQKYQIFNMVDILHTKHDFNKIYKNVLHLRLEDFITHNLYIDVNRIIKLLEKNIIDEHLCIVCNKPTMDFEYKYIKDLTTYLDIKCINYVLEHNDVITDYYIMKEAEILICSNSTLSWCASFFSDKIKKCYMPKYEISQNSTCEYPIDNTELY